MQQAIDLFRSQHVSYVGGACYRIVPRCKLAVELPPLLPPACPPVLESKLAALCWVDIKPQLSSIRSVNGLKTRFPTPIRSPSVHVTMFPPAAWATVQ